MSNEKEFKEIAIHCKNIVKAYGSGTSEVLALRGVDVDIYRGELMMIVGPSGCGKTTFISIISTMLSFDSGVCKVLGLDISKISKKERVLFRRENIGFVFQAFNLLPALTAQENVAVPLLVKGIKRKEAMERAVEALILVGLNKRHSALPAQMSGGEKQRVAIARAIVHRPKLIICDEPTSNLDHSTGLNVMRLLRSLSKELQTTVIVVTHDNRILDFADRIATMDDGKIIDIKEQ